MPKRVHLAIPVWQAAPSLRSGQAPRRRATFCLLVAALLVNCAPPQAAPAWATARAPFDIRTQTLISTPVPPESRLSAVRIIDDPGLVDFGWLPDGHVYYGIEHGDKSNWPYVSIEDTTTIWYNYDPLNGAVGEMQSLYPTVSPAMYQAITKDGKIKLMSMNVSPSGEKVLYTHLPEDFKGVSPGTPVHDYIPPIELWVARDQGRKKILLSERFSYECGMLNPVSQWLENETLVVGSCQQFYGLPGFFIADLLNHKVHLISYEQENGDLVYPASLAVAHRAPRLAIEFGSLWVVMIDVARDGFPVKLNRSSLFVDGGVGSPLWSSDDRWVYYWRWVSGPPAYNGARNPQYPWQLERINVATRHTETVLSEMDLRGILGDVLYETNMYYGVPVYWHLSGDGRQVLLFIKDALFLISW